MERATRRRRSVNAPSLSTRRRCPQVFVGHGLLQGTPVEAVEPTRNHDTELRRLIRLEVLILDDFCLHTPDPHRRHQRAHRGKPLRTGAHPRGRARHLNVVVEDNKPSTYRSRSNPASWVTPAMVARPEAHISHLRPIDARRERVSMDTAAAMAAPPSRRGGLERRDADRHRIRQHRRLGHAVDRRWTTDPANPEAAGFTLHRSRAWPDRWFVLPADVVPDWNRVDHDYGCLIGVAAPHEPSAGT